MTKREGLAPENAAHPIKFAKLQSRVGATASPARMLFGTLAIVYLDLLAVRCGIGNEEVSTTKAALSIET